MVNNIFSTGITAIVAIIPAMKVRAMSHFGSGCRSSFNQNKSQKTAGRSPAPRARNKLVESNIPLEINNLLLNNINLIFRLYYQLCYLCQHLSRSEFILLPGYVSNGINPVRNGANFLSLINFSCREY